MKCKILIRWLAITGLGGYGIYSLVHIFLNVLSQPGLDWAAFWLFDVPFIALFCGLFLAPTYFLLRQQYRHLCTFVSGLAAVIVFGFLISLPEHFGLFDRFSPPRDLTLEPPWRILLIFVGLPLSIAALWIPFYSAGWTFRRGQAFLFRFLHAETESK